ncbi:MAG: hypothetical protein KUG78_13430 [Kangiellaceae bacterium]|nr:hypothetical protein [Kangiellaceae bacterium]
MKIIFYITCIVLVIVKPLVAKSVDNERVNQLEKRITELELIVQLLIKQNEQKSILLSDKQKVSLTVDKNLTHSAVANEKAISNLESNSKNSISTNEIADFSSEPELAVYLYEDLSEELNKSIKIAGYADVEYRGSMEDGVNEEFRMHHLSLFFSKQFDNDVKFFSEIEYEDTPKFEGLNDGSGELKTSTGKIFVEAINFDWNYSQHLNVRVGRFFTPAGIWSEDHYPPFVTTQERPLHIRKIFPQLVDGMSLFGSSELTSNHFFNYITYIGNGESNVSGKKDLNSSKSVGFKGDYEAPWLDDFSLGFTLYRDNNDSSNNNAEKFAHGYHIKLRQGNVTFQGEYAKEELSFENIGEDNISDGYYAQFLYQFKQWSLGYRYDVFDKTNHDIDKITRNSLFINYHLNENFILKGEYHQDSNDDLMIEDYNYYILSVTGYLGR